MNTTASTHLAHHPHLGQRPVGHLLKDWRERRRLSQLALALETDVSARHLSFVETGKARPSRELLLRLADQMEVPLRDRNTLLLAGGYAPVFTERPLDDPDLGPARRTIDLILAALDPNPALAVDRHWTLLAANRALRPLLGGVQEAALLRPPVNVLRLSLHPAGLASAIVNLREWRGHLLHRLGRQVDRSVDPTLAELLAELRAYPVPDSNDDDLVSASAAGAIAIPLTLRLGEERLSFLSTTTVFGTPLDVTLTELAIESFFPADAETAAILRRGLRTDP